MLGPLKEIIEKELEGIREGGLYKDEREILGPQDSPIDAASLPQWLQASQEEAQKARAAGPADAHVARFVFIGIVVFLILLMALSDIACRNRIGQAVEQAQRRGAGLEEVGA